MAQPVRPVLHRSVHHGAILFVIAVVQFIGAMIVCQYYYSTNYSLTQNAISDLGNTATSPLYYVFDVSIALLGLLIIIAVTRVWNSMAPGGPRVLGLTLLMAAGVGAISVGANPENLRLSIHIASALVVFLASGVGLVVLGLGAMPRSTHWGAIGPFTTVLGAITLVAIVVLQTQYWGALGFGGVERIVVAPVLLWALVISVHLLRLPARAPSRFVSGS